MKRKLKMPSKAEQRKINRGIPSDPDTFEASDEHFAVAKPAREVLPSTIYQEVIKRRRGERGPQKAPVKEQVTLRLDRDILSHYRAMGKKWQARINRDLRRGIKAG
jgi:uncharacterized protein (DUF4415 family)